MKKNNPILAKTLALSKEYLYQYDDMMFTKEYLDSDFMASYQRLLQDMLKIEVNNTFPYFFERMALYYMEYVHYQMIEDETEKEKILLHFELSRIYASLMVQTTVQMQQCFSPPTSIWMKTGGLFLSSQIIANRWEDAESMLDAFINSINGDGSIIGYGHPEHQEAWFILDLSAKVFSKSYSQERAYLPDDYEVFQEVLDEWDTTDTIKMTIFLEKLCERHMIVNQMALQDRHDKEEEGEGVLYVDVHNFMLPYEILTWLKLRERAGLKNPKTFSHPLINTPISKMFLEIKEPLPKPKELPFAEELLEKLKQKCTNVEIPAWLEDIKRTSTQAIEQKEEIAVHNEIIKSNQVVQKSGIYQAFLPPEHPLAKQVHQMPESKRLGVAGVTMHPLGLNPKDEEQLRWEWVGE